MDTLQRPNICIKSNVYILTEGMPFNDSSYLSKVFEKSALLKLQNLISNRTIRKYWVNHAQQITLNMNMPCALHPNKRVTIGVMFIDGSYFQVIRCDYIRQCPHSERGNCKEHVMIIYNKTLT